MCSKGLSSRFTVGIGRCGRHDSVGWCVLSPVPSNDEPVLRVAVSATCPVHTTGVELIVARLEPATEAELRTVSDVATGIRSDLDHHVVVGDATFATFTDADMSVAATLVVKDCPHATHRMRPRPRTAHCLWSSWRREWCPDIYLQLHGPVRPRGPRTRQRPPSPRPSPRRRRRWRCRRPLRRAGGRGGQARR